MNLEVELKAVTESVRQQAPAEVFSVMEKANTKLAASTLVKQALKRGDRMPDFELPDGSLYVEAHHVLALSARGPDTIANVIALCAKHHREAHYGRNAEALESEFSAKLFVLAQEPSGPFVNGSSTLSRTA